MIPTLERRRDLERGARFGKTTFRTPEKHFVRIYGWLPACVAMHQRLRGEAFRYFSLCGKEPLDVIVLFRAGILTPNWKRPNVAICDINSEDLTAANEALTRAKYGVATKFNSSLEDLILIEDDNHKRFREMLPFHTYNLDFTKQIFYKKEPIQARMWEAIERIIELQSSCNQEFDIFITSRSHPPEINQRAIDILLATMNDNVTQVAGLSDLMTQKGINSFDNLRRQDFTEFFLRSLPKQIMQRALDNRFLLEIEDFFRYEKIAVKEGERYKYHIAKWCLGLRYPLAKGRRLSIGEYFARHGFDNYCDTARSLVNQTIKNVKDILSNDRQIRGQMRNDLRDLCQLAGLVA